MGKTRSTADGARGAHAVGRAISHKDVDALFKRVGQYLREGRSAEAQKVLERAITTYEHTADDLANLKRLLSFTLETAGRYKDSFETIEPFGTEENLERLGLETRLKVVTQLAIAYNNTGDQPKAVHLLKEAYATAEEHHLSQLYGPINVSLARVYRKLAEYPICRDYAQKALDNYRQEGNWLGMSEAYKELANSFHQEGNGEKAIENFQLGIKIIGANAAPFMLGKLYTDMSGAYWFLRRPQDGIACLEKSIEYFGQTEHAINSVIAYNNLGMNLLLIGEWSKAEEMIAQSLEIALKFEKYDHVAGIYDSLAEVKLLREELDEAETLLEKGLEYAHRVKNSWYTVQLKRNLARCYLTQQRFRKAIPVAHETIKLCAEIGDKHHENMAAIVLAEAHLKLGDAELCEQTLQQIEATDPSADFFVLGNIQRIRGLAAMADEDRELAVHHFSRALTIFETAEDLYHTGLMHYLLGSHLEERDLKRARNHLVSALDIFRKLGIPSLTLDSESELARVDQARSEQRTVPPVKRTNSVVSQLLTVRLAEATASRELLFRELVAVLQQESDAKRIVIAQYDEGKRLYPFITHGYSPAEGNELVGRLREALHKGEEKAFVRAKNVTIFHLNGQSAQPAILVISPASSAALSDGSTLQPLLRVVELGMDLIALRSRDRSQPAELDASPYTSTSLMPGFIHSSPAMTSLVEEVYKIRSSDVTVLVTGESGTGKELVSRAIHAISNRKDQVFVPFNCTAVPKELAEGHLFGYKKGAFTGAVNDSPGVIRTADGGTLFLDEVGDLPLDVQPKLLRFLQEGEIQPLGDKKPLKVDVRIIAATNMPLEEKVADGSFREDLYYRLNVIRLRVPPLRERRAEIPPIVNYYVNHYSDRFGKSNVTFTPQTVDMLMVCNWEGNVRQLCNEIQRIVARAESGEVITPQHLSPELKRIAQPLTAYDAGSNVKPIRLYDSPLTPFTNIPEGGTLEEAVSELEMQLIRASLTRHNWNISRVANELGLTRRGLYLKLSRYGIEKAA